MSQVKVLFNSAMDKNLEEYVRSGVNNDWEEVIKSLPYVKDAKWITIGSSIGGSYTLITFENEAHKTWFLLRWS